VGANGSGKTTTVSLLSRLFDVTSGEILIDDRPISSFQVQSLRNAQAVLRQKYQHFPFSLRENIGMGDPDWLRGVGEDALRNNIDSRVLHAAKLGGADELIEEVQGMDRKRVEALKKLESKSNQKRKKASLATAKGQEVDGVYKERAGWDVNVLPVGTWEGSWQLRGSKLADMSEEIEKVMELSGGQWQRLALARLFMRAERECVRLVCTDEPSAALDPKAEFGESFFHRYSMCSLTCRNLPTIARPTREEDHEDIHNPSVWASYQICRPRIVRINGCISLFFTDPFRRCLKKGELVEAGTHEELMKTNGEYATLYNIQAQAFQMS